MPTYDKPPTIVGPIYLDWDDSSLALFGPDGDYATATVEQGTMARQAYEGFFTADEVLSNLTVQSVVVEIQHHYSSADSPVLGELNVSLFLTDFLPGLAITASHSETDVLDSLDFTSSTYHPDLRAWTVADLSDLKVLLTANNTDTRSTITWWVDFVRILVTANLAKVPCYPLLLVAHAQAMIEPTETQSVLLPQNEQASLVAQSSSLIVPGAGLATMQGINQSTLLKPIC